MGRRIRDLHACRQLGLIPGAMAFSVLVGVIVIDAWFLYRFFAVESASRTKHQAVVVGHLPV